MGFWYDPYTPTQEALNLELECFEDHNLAMISFLDIGAFGLEDGYSRLMESHMIE